MPFNRLHGRDIPGSGATRMLETPPVDCDDWFLVSAAAAGNDGAFEMLMDRYKGPVINFVYRMTGAPADAEDMAQETFVRLHGALTRGSVRRRPNAFSTYLFQIARNVAIDALRRRARRPLVSLDDIEARGHGVASGEQSPLDRLMADELGRQIASAVTDLPEDQRTALVLAEYEGMSYGQIAGVMKCSIKSVEARLYRARKRLRHVLAPL